MKHRRQVRSCTKLSTLLLVFLFSCALVPRSTALAQEAAFSFGSGSVGATWYYAIGGFLQTVKDDLKGFQVSVAATGGSVENLRLLGKKQSDFAWAHAGNMYDAWNGVGIFKGKPKNRDFRMLARAYGSEHTIICLDDGKTRSLGDLKGEKVQMGPPGSGTSVNTENIFKGLGLFEEIKPLYLTASDAVSALGDGKIKALGQSAGPAASITSLATMKKIYMIPLSEGELRKIVKTYPFYTAGTVKPNMYPGNVPPKEIPSIWFQVYWIAHKDVPDKYVYEILKAGFAEKNRPALIKVHRYFKALAPELNGMAGLKIPLHPGAEKFWKDQGLKIPAAIKAK